MNFHLPKMTLKTKKKQSQDKLLDFRNFLYVIWKHLRLPEPTPIQYDIANYLQSGEKRLIIEGFRGVGKSWITSAFALHQLYLNPQMNILVVSASKSRSDDFSTFCLRLLYEVPMLQHLCPTDSQRQSKIAFDVKPARASHQPSVKSVGIFGQITGSRADLIIADDIETPINSMTQGMRDRLSETVKEFESVIKPDARIVFLGTPQCESSLYNLLPERGYKKRVWTARYPDDKQKNYLGHSLAPLILNAVELDKGIIGKSTEPQRFTDEDLLEREASYGRSQFALQFQLDTRLSDSDRYPLKLSDLVVTSLNPEKAYEKYVWASNPELRCNELPCVGISGDYYYRPMDMVGDLLDYTGSVMSVDPSGSGKDESSYCVTKFLNGQIFVFECGGFGGGFSDEVLMKLTKIAKKHQVNSILIEQNFGQGMFSQLLKPFLRKEYNCSIEEVRHNKAKHSRLVGTLEPLLNQHRIIIDENVIKNDYNSSSLYKSEVGLRYQLFYQMSRLTNEKGSLTHDDRIDALEMACNYWLEQMARDADLAIIDRKRELIDNEIDKFMEVAIGQKPKATSWIN